MMIRVLFVLLTLSFYNLLNEFQLLNEFRSLPVITLDLSPSNRGLKRKGMRTCKKGIWEFTGKIGDIRYNLAVANTVVSCRS